MSFTYWAFCHPNSWTMVTPWVRKPSKGQKMTKMRTFSVLTHFSASLRTSSILFMTTISLSSNKIVLYWVMFHTCSFRKLSFYNFQWLFQNYWCQPPHIFSDIWIWGTHTGVSHKPSFPPQSSCPTKSEINFESEGFKTFSLSPYQFLLMM